MCQYLLTKTDVGLFFYDFDVIDTECDLSLLRIFCNQASDITQ